MIIVCIRGSLGGSAQLGCTYNTQLNTNMEWYVHVFRFLLLCCMLLQWPYVQDDHSLYCQSQHTQTNWSLISWFDVYNEFEYYCFNIIIIALYIQCRIACMTSRWCGCKCDCDVSERCDESNTLRKYSHIISNKQ